jgi:hypothetical protein
MFFWIEKQIQTTRENIRKTGHYLKTLLEQLFNSRPATPDILGSLFNPGAF